MSEPEVSRPGSILRAEREALGVTVREVSETLNLSMTVIEAIEADDYERLPGPVFARGYVRAYARLLELEPNPLLAQIPRPPDPMEAVPERPELPVWEWIRRRPGLVLGGAAGLLVAVVVMMVVWLWPGGESQDARSGTAPGAVPDTAAPPGPAPVAGLAARTPTSPQSQAEASGAEPLTDGGTAAAAPAPDAPVMPSSDEAAAPAAGVMTAAPAAGEPSTVRRITEQGDDRLSFTFSDDCWVEIKNGSGASLYSDLSRGGSHLELVGHGPFRILLGYAPGARLSFNGDSVALAPHTRDNVATLVLGQ